MANIIYITGKQGSGKSLIASQIKDSIHFEDTEDYYDVKKAVFGRFYTNIILESQDFKQEIIDGLAFLAVESRRKLIYLTIK